MLAGPHPRSLALRRSKTSGSRGPQALALAETCQSRTVRLSPTFGLAMDQGMAPSHLSVRFQKYPQLQ
jgi:hypothetical protein